MKKITCLIFLCFCSYTAFSQLSCAAALEIAPGQHDVVFPTGSTQIPAPQCMPGAAAAKGMWYKYTATQLLTATITTFIPGYPSYDTRVHIYEGPCGSLGCITGNDDGGQGGGTSLANFTVIPGKTYYIVFDSRYSSQNFRFEFTLAPYIPQIFTPQNISLTGAFTICAVDMNGDYLDDLVAVNSNHISVMYQTASGFTAPVILPCPGAITHMPGWSMAAGDYNKDGFNDLLMGGHQGATLLLSNSTGTAFTTAHNSPQYVFSQRTNFIDINNDGHLDAFVCHDVQPNVYFKNNGTGGFTFHQGGLGDVSNGGNYGSIWVDYDNDGDSDLFIAKCRGGGSVAAVDELHRNNGDGTFTNVASSANLADSHQSWSSAWADFDNDGDMDAMIGASSGTHKLMRNNDGVFSNIVNGSGLIGTSQEHVAHDFNNDGYVDILSGGNMYQNNGNMTFTNKANVTKNGPVGDFNNDGFLDIQTDGIIHMGHDNGNKWIKIHLKGITSNSNGIGARVELYGTWGKQIRDVRSGDGFEFMSSLNTHFGIGTATAIEKVVIKWPSGIVDTVYNPAVKQSLLITEGSTLSVGDHTNSTFMVYPNPVKDFIEIQGDTGLNITNAKIYDMNGRLVKSLAVDGSKISAQGLAKGNYVLILLDKDKKQHTQKIVKE